MHRYATLSGDRTLSRREILDLVVGFGGEILTLRAGQIFQYEDQMPRGVCLLTEGELLLSSARGEPVRVRLADGPLLIPELPHLDGPLLWTVRASTDIGFWFFSRSLCLPGTTLRFCLEDLHEPSNPIAKLWKTYGAGA